MNVESFEKNVEIFGDMGLFSTSYAEKDIQNNVKGNHFDQILPNGNFYLTDDEQELFNATIKKEISIEGTNEKDKEIKELLKRKTLQKYVSSEDLKSDGKVKNDLEKIDFKKIEKLFIKAVANRQSSFMAFIEYVLKFLTLETFILRNYEAGKLAHRVKEAYFFVVGK